MGIPRELTSCRNLAYMSARNNWYFLGNFLLRNLNDLGIVTEFHCVKSVHIWSYSGLYFPAFGLNTNQNNSKYGLFLRSVLLLIPSRFKQINKFDDFRVNTGL